MAIPNKVGLVIVIGMLIQEIAAQGEWRGTATELWKKLGDLAGEDAQKQAGWPKNGRCCRIPATLLRWTRYALALDD
jgi:hypothetical protein